MNEFVFENIRMICGDNREFLASLPDKSFDLAIDDPPYGIKRDGGETGKNWKWYEPKEWDNERPEKDYFSLSYGGLIILANIFPLPWAGFFGTRGKT